jgi:hypothetical protein
VVDGVRNLDEESGRAALAMQRRHVGERQVALLALHRVAEGLEVTVSGHAQVEQFLGKGQERWR